MLQSDKSIIECNVHYIDFRDVKSHCYNIPRAMFDRVRYALPFDRVCTVGPVVEDNSWHNERSETSVNAVEDGHAMSFRWKELYVDLSGKMYQRYCMLEYRTIALTVVQWQLCAEPRLIVFDPFHASTLSTIDTLARMTFHVY